MGRRVIAGVLAVVLAAAGTVVLVMYVRGAEERALAGQEAVSVLVVSETIPEGTSAEDARSMIESRHVPASVRADGSVDDLDTLEGQVASVELVPGEQVVRERFVNPAAFEASGDVDIPEGFQVLTIEQPAERVIGGQLAPGDTVGVISSGDCELLFQPEEGGAEGDGESEETPCSTFLLHKVLVTNVQGDGVPENEDEQRDGQPDSSQMVSLAVDSGDAVRLVYAREHGTIWLTNEPEDATEDGPMFQNRFSILEGIASPGAE